LATCELQVIMQLVVVEVSGVARPVRGGVTVGMEVCASVSHAPAQIIAAAARIVKRRMTVSTNQATSKPTIFAVLCTPAVFALSGPNLYPRPRGDEAGRQAWSLAWLRHVADEACRRHRRCMPACYRHSRLDGRHGSRRPSGCCSHTSHGAAGSGALCQWARTGDPQNSPGTANGLFALQENCWVNLHVKGGKVSAFRRSVPGNCERCQR
jgi:hypothetical protein